MLSRLQRLPFLYLLLLSVGGVLLTVQIPFVVLEIVDKRQEIELAAERQANAAIDMLEAVHIQSMLFRDQTEDNDPAIDTLNGSMAQFSEVNESLKLWLFMGPKVIDYQIDAGETEIEGPLDPIDRAVLASGETRRAFEATQYRLSRPVVMGQGHAAHPKCASCHTALMGIQAGEVIGGYSAAVDLTGPLAHWRSGIAKSIGWALAIFTVTLAAIFAVLKAFALRPLKALSRATKQLASGETNVVIDLDERHDAIGSMARSLRIFRDSLSVTQCLQQANDVANDELRYLASHDALTGLSNRSLFTERLTAAVSRCATSNEKLAVLCLDIDRFKDVNDEFGHKAGDYLLQGVADRLRSVIGETGLAARFGGDEFVLAFPTIIDLVHAERICARLITAMSQPFELGVASAVSTVSIGLALYPSDGDNAESLLRNADAALYRSKAEGRNTYRFFAPEMNAAIQERREIERELRTAFEAGNLELHYQPLIDVASNQIIGVEALMRWPHPERGWISPSVFIPVAESCGLIGPMGRWLIETACRQAALWPEVVMSVNVSPAQFKDQNLVPFIAAVLATTGLRADRLEIEITEGLLIENSEQALHALNALKALGVRVAMDDFGTGYSSLGYLQSFPFDKIKIDRSFVGSLGESGNAAAIVRSVVSLGQSLGMKTTAEGVETDEQLTFLRSEGCDQVQGYYFSKPVDALRLTSLLASWSNGTGETDRSSQTSISDVA